MLQKGNEWEDHAGRSVPKVYVPEIKQREEKFATAIFKMANDMLNSVLAAKQEMITLCAEELDIKMRENPKLANQKQISVYSFDKSIRVDWFFEETTIRLYLATKKYPTSKDYVRVIWDFKEINMNEVLTSLKEARNSEEDIDLSKSPIDLNELFSSHLIAGSEEIKPTEEENEENDDVVSEEKHPQEGRSYRKKEVDGQTDKTSPTGSFSDAGEVLKEE